MQEENTGFCGHAISHIKDSVESPFGCVPLLSHDYWPVSKFRNGGMKLPLRKKIALEFKGTEHKVTLMPDLSGQSGGTQSLGYAKHLNKRRSVYEMSVKSTNIYLYYVATSVRSCHHTRFGPGPHFGICNVSLSHHKSPAFARFTRQISELILIEHSLVQF